MTDNTLLTSRETEILALIAEGKSNKEIAAELFISVNTVKVHVSKIFQKIEVSSRTEATLYAIEHGVVQSPATPIPQTDDMTSFEITIDNETPESTKKNWLGNNWWILLLGILILFVITQATVPSISLFMTSPTANPVIEALNQNRMETIEPMSVPRTGFASVINTDEIYIIGGIAEDSTVNLIEKYSITADTWEVLPEKPTSVSEINAVFLRGSIYVPGGKLSDGSLTNVLEVYNLSEKTWEEKAPIPEKISNYSLVTFEGQLFLFGGWIGDNVTDLVFRYDPSLDEWFPCAPMPTARMNTSATVLGARIFVIGGNDGDKELASNESYLPSFGIDDSNEWQKNENLPFVCDFCSSNSLSDQMFVVGNDRIWQYSHGSQKWTQILLNPDQAIPGQVRSVVSLEGSLFIFGGTTTEGSPANLAVKYRVIYTISIPNVINE